MEIKRCVRCGTFFSSEIDVCKSCEKKDNVDVNKLKGFLMEGLETGTTKTEVAHSVGITMKNLNRYLSADEFKGVKIPDIKSDFGKSEDEIVTKV